MIIRMTEIKERMEYEIQAPRKKIKIQEIPPKKRPYPLWYMVVHSGDYWIGNNLEIFINYDSVVIEQVFHKIKYEYTGAMICYKCNYIHPCSPAPHYCPKCNDHWYWKNYWNKKQIIDTEKSKYKVISLYLWEYLLNLQNLLSMRASRRLKKDFDDVFPLDCLNPPDDINY